MIPATSITGHLEWSDIWGRVWVEPIRSVFTDVAPLPGPLRNFWMTTTYELLDPATNTRFKQWQSDTNLTVRYDEFYRRYTLTAASSFMATP